MAVQSGERHPQGHIQAEGLRRLTPWRFIRSSSGAKGTGRFAVPSHGAAHVQRQDRVVLR